MASFRSWHSGAPSVAILMNMARFAPNGVQAGRQMTVLNFTDGERTYSLILDAAETARLRTELGVDALPPAAA